MIEMVTIAVREPEEGIVAVRQSVGSDPGGMTSVLPASVTSCHDTGDLSGRSHVVLQPLVIYHSRSNINTKKSLYITFK